MNQGHLTILDGGVDHWNRWRRENPDIKPDLTGADLRNRDLRAINFSNSILTEANLSSSTLNRANLSNSGIQGAKFIESTCADCIFFSARLEGADLRGAVLSGSEFQFADLRKANLTGSWLTHANLQNAILRKTILRKAKLRFANLSGSDMEGSNLAHANFENAIFGDTSFLGFVKAITSRRQIPAILREANLESSRLIHATGFLLDSNPVKGIRYSPRSLDIWSCMRRKYSGYRLLIHLTLLLAFVSPYILKIGMLTLLSDAQEYSNRMVSTNLPDSLGQDTAATSLKERLKDTLAEGLRKALPSEQSGWKKYYAYEILIGLNEGTVHLLLTISVILYNLLRGVLTFRIYELRGEEDRTDISPRKQEYYPTLYVLNLIANVVLSVAICSFLKQFYEVLSTEFWMYPC
ncbi:pentapeptide repeat-containing protein [Candidatus Zixiibacteriota bacterium]